MNDQNVGNNISEDTSGTSTKLNKIIESQRDNRNSIQQDIYEIGINSVTTNALTVLVTLTIVGMGVFFLAKKVVNFLSTHIVPDLKAYLSTQEKFIKCINGNAEDIKKNLIILEHNTNQAHIKVISKLEAIELDVKEIKIILNK